MKQSKPIKAWAGFSSHRLHIDVVDDGWGGRGQHERRVPAIFMSYTEAKEQYQDVRRIEIREVDVTNG